MANFAPTFTERYRLKYTAGGVRHTCTLRVSVTALADDIMAVFEGLWGALNGDVLQPSGFQFDIVERANKGDSFFVPAATQPQWDPAYIGSTGTPSVGYQQLTFMGVTTIGTIAKITLFGVADSVMDTHDNNFRIPATAANAVGEAVELLNDASSVLVGPDENPVVWRRYANVKTNDYWVRRARLGG